MRRILAGVNSKIGAASLRPTRSNSTQLSLRTDLPDIAALLDSDQFQAATAQLAAQLGCDGADIRTEAAGYIREMAARHDPIVFRAWHRIASWLVRGYDIVTDDAQLSELRELDRKNTLIFLLSHRSYLDEFALPPTLIHKGISPFRNGRGQPRFLSPRHAGAAQWHRARPSRLGRYACVPAGAGRDCRPNGD
jgi:hypothetical protein